MMKIFDSKLVVLILLVAVAMNVAAAQKVKELESEDDFQCFVVLNVAENNILVNQETLLQVKIYTNDKNIANVHYNPFSVVGLEIGPKNFKGKWTTEKYKGKEMSCYTLAEYYVTPLNSGTYNIGGEECIVERYTIEQVYDRFWGYSNRRVSRKYTTKMNEVKLKVKDINKEYKSLPVGEFNISAKVAPGYIKPGEDALILVTIEGYGSLAKAVLKDVKANCENAGVKLKEVNQNLSRYVKDGKTWHEKEFEVWVVAPDDGEINIPSFEFEFIDSSTRKRKLIKSESLTINSGETVKEKENLKSKPKVIQAI